MDATLNIFICTVLVVKIPSKAISPLAFPASRGFQWNRCAVCLQNGRLDADRCHGAPSRRSTLRTLVVFAAESWKLASSFCTHPAQKKKSWVLESGSETQYLVLAKKNYNLAFIVLPLLPSSRLESFPPSPATAGLRPHSLRPPAALLWPAACQFPRLTRGLAQPVLMGHKYIKMFEKVYGDDKNLQNQIWKPVNVKCCCAGSFLDTFN